MTIFSFSSSYHFCLESCFVTFRHRRPSAHQKAVKNPPTFPKPGTLNAVGRAAAGMEATFLCRSVNMTVSTCDNSIWLSRMQSAPLPTLAILLLAGHPGSPDPLLLSRKRRFHNIENTQTDYFGIHHLGQSSCFRRWQIRCGVAVSYTGLS